MEQHSLNLNAEPVCIYPQRFSIRTESILRLTRSLHRHAEAYCNFDEVNLILDSERKKASDWLKMILSETREYNA